MTQTEMVLRHLQDQGTLTAAEAVTEYGCYRLSGRIYDLKAQGYRIGKRMVTSKNRYGDPVSFAEYFLLPEADE